MLSTPAGIIEAILTFMTGVWLSAIFLFCSNLLYFELFHYYAPSEKLVMLGFPCIWLILGCSKLTGQR